MGLLRKIFGVSDRPKAPDAVVAAIFLKAVADGDLNQVRELTRVKS